MSVLVEMGRDEARRMARRWRAEGLVVREIATLLNTPRSTISAWLDPNHMEKQRARRLRYQGTCVDCGAATDGSAGYGKAPARCSRCAVAKQMDEKTWTRDAVVDAIRRFADANGRAPLSTDWIRADAEHGYPCRGSVYRSTDDSRSPFATWNDAITAAGFEALPRGKYIRTEETLRRLSEVRTKWTRDLIVLRIQEWNAVYGQPPKMSEWNPWLAEAKGFPEQAARFRAAENFWPYSGTVLKRLGSWNAAISAAGFSPRRQGWQSKVAA